MYFFIAKAAAAAGLVCGETKLGRFLNVLPRRLPLGRLAGRHFHGT